MRVFAAISASAARRSDRIVMDAPPDKEDLGPFLRVTRAARRCGVHVPEVLERRPRRAASCCSTIWARRTTWPRLSARRRRRPALRRRDWRRCCANPAARRAPARAAARRTTPRPPGCARCSCCPDGSWPSPRRLAPRRGRARAARATFELLVRERARRSRTVLVHRDYHSRNLMVARRAQSRHHRFPGRGGAARSLRPGLAPQGLLHRLAARRACSTGSCDITGSSRRRGAGSRAGATRSSCAGST